MKTKAIVYILSFFIAMFISACYDRTSLQTEKKYTNSDHEGPLSAMLKKNLDEVNDTIKLAFEGKKLFTSNLIKELYTLNKFHPVWTEKMLPNDNSIQLISLVKNARNYGLEPSFYQLEELEKMKVKLNSTDSSERKKVATEFEFLMSHNCFKLMSHLQFGLLNADTTVFGKQNKKYPAIYPGILLRMLHSSDLKFEIINLQPKSYEYRRLQNGLEQFLQHSNLSEERIKIPDAQKEPGMAYQIAENLLIKNQYLDLNHYTKRFAEFQLEKIRKIGPSSNENFTYNYLIEEDTMMINALKKFQLNHGLSPDGKIGPNTARALEMSNLQRYEQIAVNLERLKWENNRPPKYVYVNIPSYRLRVIEEYRIIKTFHVVVGAIATETPILNSKIEYFITNPDWYVPYSISSKELLPKIKLDSNYLEKHNFKVLDINRLPVNYVDWASVDLNNFNYYFQQSAGEGNALGKIKFYFENPYIVYIHDTNDKAKFAKDIRAFSHGCVRLQNPGELAKILMKLDSNPQADSVDKWLQGNRREKVNFNEQFPLYIRYLTCEADSEANITFYKDIYNKDDKLKQKLFSYRDF